MLKLGSNPRQQPAPDEAKRPETATKEPETTDLKSTDPTSFLRAYASAQLTVDDLREQPGFGVVVAASELQGKPPAPNPAPAQNIGQKLASELDILSRRQRQIQEIQELATRLVLDLTVDELRRILEFMA